MQNEEIRNWCGHCARGSWWAFVALMKVADDLDLYDEVDEDDSGGEYEAGLK